MILAALLSWFLVGLFIHVSKLRGWGQPVRKDGPQTHLQKEGTPTAGGVAFVLAFLVMWLAERALHPPVIPADAQREVMIVLSAIGMGLIGFADDFLKIRSRMVGGKKELLAREKFPLQLLVGAVFAYFAAPLSSHLLAVSFGPVWDVVLITLVMVAAVNAFNFTDGLDGLLGGVSLIVLLPFLGVSPAALLLVGAVLGFMWYNAHPARVFMGDMGSHAIGAVAAGVYVLYADPWLLPVAAIIPVAAVLSVIIQVASFKTTGRRVFKMSPIQHHFELSGWKETQVTVRFWVITALATAAAWSLIGGRW
ncbi:phospho-N-acetylmuramoyl-pentapeptide-transferase [Deinococcus irradiatisoli]|uniref:Phospho-N-acetylmuramoyl-pentapeptide-transferase n=1 Tax=Deinococcus irradiatisoli TaxID=2202254 RepID=A0A2Z3JIV8_9DEIO|nr:phospho-N-acetylmuramoyl-pentapeptide-transferase [Deinococcus irradiatisoli]AWN23300.1 phospho-N-acetylmuramoyl-pentapeptide-transferase [Deinococcus irradiatisoli]